MNKTTIDARLAKLEVKRGPATRIHCVQVGDNPPSKVDGSECHLHHARVIVIGGVYHASKSD